VALDSNFAEGYAALALSQQTLATVGYNARYWTEFSKARQAAQRALEIDDRLGGAHATLGFILWCHDWDFPEARRALERAIQLSPNDQEALGGYAWFLLAVDGRTQDALAVSDRLMQVAPFDLYSRSERIGHFSYARQYERALGDVQLVRELTPSFVDSGIADTYFMLGRLDEEHRERLNYYKHCGAPCSWALEARERGWAEGGWTKSVRAWLDAATRRKGFSPFEIAVHYAMIDEREEAFRWLERGYRERDPMMVFLKGRPSFDSLRSDPRFDELLHRIGFPEE
jgi:tetratricopeptide (TPR) repeat protein